MLENLPLSEEVINLFKNYGKMLYYKKGDILQNCPYFNLGVCILTSGIVKISINHNNHKTLLYHIDCSSPQIMNHTNSLNISYEAISSTALKDSIVINIPNNLFIEWTSAYIDLRDFMIDSFQYHYINIINKTQEFNNQSLEVLLLNYIKTKSKLYKDLEIKIPLLEISEDLNFSREAISRSLKILEKNGKIIRKTRSIILLAS